MLVYYPGIFLIFPFQILINKTDQANDTWGWCNYQSNVMLRKLNIKIYQYSLKLRYHKTRMQKNKSPSINLTWFSNSIEHMPMTSLGLIAFFTVVKVITYFALHSCSCGESRQLSYAVYLQITLKTRTIFHKTHIPRSHLISFTNLPYWTSSSTFHPTHQHHMEHHPSPILTPPSYHNHIPNQTSNLHHVWKNTQIISMKTSKLLPNLSNQN